MKAQWFYVLLTIAAGRTILLSPIEMFQEMTHVNVYVFRVHENKWP